MTSFLLLSTITLDLDGTVNYDFIKAEKKHVASKYARHVAFIKEKEGISTIEKRASGNIQLGDNIQGGVDEEYYGYIGIG